MVLTRKAVVYLAAAYVFIGLALMSKEPSLTVFVMPLALAFFYSSFLIRSQRLNLKIERTLNPPRSFGGESINVTVEVRNESSSQIDELLLEDQIPDSLELESGSSSLILSLRPGENVQHSYMISAPKRGRYLLGPMKASSMDILGFRQYSEEIPAMAQVMILPKVEEVGTVELRARKVGPWPGTVPSKFVGAGTEFFELRTYLPGDELRRVNWKASAKQGRLVTNEYEAERVTDVLVVLDCSEGVLSRLFDFDAQEFEVDLAASLCSQLIFQGNRVGVMVYGAERTWVAPAFGKRQLLRILNGLAIVRAGRAVVPIAYVVETIVSAVLPARSVIVFVSPLMSDEIIEVVWDVAAAGYSLICFTPIANSSLTNDSESELLARRIIVMERRINMSRIASVSRLYEVGPRTSIRLLLRRKMPWKMA